MKAIKISILVLILLAAGFFTASALLSPSVRVEERIEINADDRSVFGRVNILKQWKLWDPWQRQDPEMDIRYSKQQSGVGAWFRWSSKSQGNGKLTITRAKKFSYIRTIIELEGFDSLESSFSFASREDKAATSVEWRIKFELPYLWRIPGHIFALGASEDMREGLANLKKLSEEKDPEAEKASAIKLVPITTQHMYYVFDSTHFRNVFGHMRTIFAELLTFTEKEGIAVTGPPMAFFYQFHPDGLCIYEAAYPVAQLTIDSSGRIVAGIITEGEALTATHYGAYLKANTLYTKFEEHVDNFGYELRGPPWEVYKSGFLNEPDTSKWEMDIYYPVK